MIPIALVTCKEYPHLFEEDRLLIEPLQKQGFAPHAAIWNDKKVQWNTYKALIIRTTWDFYKHIGNFYAWLDVLESLHIPVWNPLHIIRWNIDKPRYLQDITHKHIPVIPSMFLEKNARRTLRDVLDKENWQTAIVKPRYGASGEGIFKVTRKDVASKEDEFRRMLQHDTVIVQPFMKEIYDGEYSFIFFNGKFSHTVLKKPQKDEYRVNFAFGGIWTNISVNDDFLSQVKRVYVAIGSSLLCARIDMLNVKGKLVLNELELTDPFLFLKWKPESATTFAEAFRDLFDKHV